ncbi:hypothetical protein ACLBXM_19085 [Xanthobacteraceae bacterium A53D]
MKLGYDERCAADLSNVVEGRSLSREDAAWLLRVVTGAVRPNRDKPLWDLAHLLRALAPQDAPDDTARGDAALCDLILDPTLARAEPLSRRLGSVTLNSHARLDGRGLVLDGLAQPWQASWTGMARLLALAEFLLTAEDLAHFATLRGWMAELVETEDARGAIDLLVKRLSRHASAYRQAHLPLAPVERRFRAILAYLAARDGHRRHADFGDDDILGFWRAEAAEGERAQFRTVAEHFVTYHETLSLLGGLAGLQQAASLDGMEDWADRLEASLDAAVGLDDAMLKLASALAAIPDSPKILTGAERDDLIDILWLEPFHRARPLTVLRAISFGRVQSGIANRLRRGSGGAEVAERVGCADAETYAAILARATALAGHLERMTRIAAALRLGSGGEADAEIDATLATILAAAEADLARVRRAGFDQDRATLARAFAMVDETLVRLLAEVPAFARAASALPGRFEADRATFAAAFTQTYLGTETHEHARPVTG